MRRFTVESKRLDIVRIQFLNPREQFRQRNSKGEMTVVRDPIFSAISGVRSPQTDHRFLFLVGPKENDIARRVAIREGQPDNFSIEFLRAFRVRDRQVCFVEMHRCVNRQDQGDLVFRPIRLILSILSSFSCRN